MYFVKKFLVLKTLLLEKRPKCCQAQARSHIVVLGMCKIHQDRFTLVKRNFIWSMPISGEH